MSCVQCGCTNVKFTEPSTRSLYCSKVCQEKYYDAPLVGYKANPKLHWTENMLNAVRDNDEYASDEFFRKLFELKEDVLEAAIQTNDIRMVTSAISWDINPRFYTLFKTNPAQTRIITYLLRKIDVISDDVQETIDRDRLDLFDAVFKSQTDPNTRFVQESMWHAFKKWLYIQPPSRAYVDSLIDKGLFSIDYMLQYIVDAYIQNPIPSVIAAIRYLLEHGNGGINPARNGYLDQFKREIANRNDLDTEKLLQSAIDRWRR